MKITLGVTGSISAYKSIELLRLLIKEGHEVKVVLSAGALKFVKAELFSYLGASDVFTPEDDFSFPHNSKTALKGNVLHVELAKWSDKLIIAPLSANTLSSFASAGACDLLTSLFLAWERHKPILVFPAMNTQMLSHPFVQANFEKLAQLENIFVAPTQAGTLACGDEGAGKLLEVDKIFHLSISLNPGQRPKETKNILMSAGATVAPLDSVRYLTNASSGKTSIPFIIEALNSGHKVTVVAGTFATESLDFFSDHPNFLLKRVKTTNDMLESIDQFFPKSDIYISMAAIGDIHFESSQSKIKKSELNSSLAILRSVDILKTMLEKKKEHQILIGFAAETELTDQVLVKKMKRKPVDMLIGTEVDSGLVGNSSLKGFQTNSAFYRIVDSDHRITPLVELTKGQLAKIVAHKYF